MLAAELAHREVKHVQMRELLDWLTFHRFCGRQRGLCAALELPPAYVSQYKSGKGGRGTMSPAHLDVRMRGGDITHLRCGVCVYTLLCYVLSAYCVLVFFNFLSIVGKLL